MKKRTTSIIIFITTSCLFFSGCGIQPTTSPTNIPSQQGVTVIEFGEISTIPCDTNCPYIHKGRGRAENETTIWTVKHLIPDTLSQLKITGSNKQECTLKNLRIHPTQDLALIHTTNPCGIQEKNTQGKVFTQRTIVIGNGVEIVKDVSFETTVRDGDSSISYVANFNEIGYNQQQDILLNETQIQERYTITGIEAQEGMSGSPLVNAQGGVVGLLSSTNTLGITTFIDLEAFKPELLTLSEE